MEPRFIYKYANESFFQETNDWRKIANKENLSEVIALGMNKKEFRDMSKALCFPGQLPPKLTRY